MKNKIGSERFFSFDLKVIRLLRMKLNVAPVRYENLLELEKELKPNSLQMHLAPKKVHYF